MRRLSGIFIYPVKSLGGIELRESSVHERGLANDRRWLVVDEKGDFLTQRQIPAMATIDTEISEDSLILKARSGESDPLHVPLIVEGNKIPVRVWRDTVEAIDVGDEAAAWLSQALGHSCRLVWMPDETKRFADPVYALNGEIVSFADGFPFLILGQASLDDLNNRLDEQLPVNRFRPNFLFDGEEAFEEDGWARFRIGEVELEAVKPCARCIITTIDQMNGTKPSKEPLFTLAQYRNQEGKVNFAQNAIPRSLGTVRVGDEIEVLSHRETGA